MQSGWAKAICTGAAYALGLGVAATSDANDLDSVLDSAGVARHLEAWPETNVEATEQAKAALDPDDYALLMREVRVAFDAPTLLRNVSETLSSQLDPAAVSALRLGYAQSGATGLTGPPAGIPASDLREFPGFTSELSRGEVAPIRFRLVARIDKSSGLSRNAWRVSSAVDRAISGGARALACETGAWQKSLASQQANRAGLLGPFRERLHLELLFLARARTSDELRAAVRFLESPQARAFHEALAEALPNALDAAQQTLQQRLARRVGEKCSP